MGGLRTSAVHLDAVPGSNKLLTEVLGVGMRLIPMRIVCWHMEIRRILSHAHHSPGGQRLGQSKDHSVYVRIAQRELRVDDLDLP